MNQDAAITTNLLGRRAELSIPEPFPRAGEIGEVVALRHQGCNTFVMLLYSDGAAEEHTLQQIKFEPLDEEIHDKDDIVIPAAAGHALRYNILLLRNGAVPSGQHKLDALVQILTEALADHDHTIEYEP